MTCDICEFTRIHGHWPPHIQAHCNDRHATWTGRAEHCVRCHETFSGTSAADQHEVIDKRDASIYCLSPEDRGLVWSEKRHLWTWEGSDENMARVRALRGQNPRGSRQEAVL